MYQTSEQLMALNRANVNIALRFAGVTLAGAERLLDLQLNTAKAVLNDTAEQAAALANAGDVTEFAAIRENLAQPTLEKTTAYVRSVYDVTVETQARIGELVEERAAEFNRQVVSSLDQFAKSAPAGSEAAIAGFKSTIAAVNFAYDNFAKATRQFAELTQTGVNATVNQASAHAQSTRGSRKKAA
ncbi:MAG TPA: phasin family protein [Burkholderiales bacterium]|nr:phasin family protein [Burkholderiales bacterium]